MKIACCNCGKEFEKRASRVARQKRCFCSSLCWQRHDEYHNKQYFENINCEEKSYWLGMIMSDGYLIERDSAIGLQLHIKDIDVLERFSATFDVPLKIYSGDRGRCIIYSKTIFNTLTKMGIHPKKSLKDVVDIFNHIPQPLISHFVRGWFDGDGSVGLYKNKEHKLGNKAYVYDDYQFSITGTYNAMTRLSDIIKNNSKIQSVAKIYKCKSVFAVRFGGPQVAKIGEWLYKNASIFMMRKKIIFDSVFDSVKENDDNRNYR